MRPLIYIVDDDPSVRRALKRLIRSVDMDAQVFASAREFLDHPYKVQNVCMVADIRLQGLSGLDLQNEIRARGKKIPMIFITGYDSAQTREEAKRAGAVGYFRKPIDDQALMDAIEWALTTNKAV